MEKEKKKVSYSEYVLWMNCPLQWKLTYPDGHKSYEPSIALVFGTAMHEVIQYWMKLVFTKGLRYANHLDLDDMLRENLIKIFKESTIVSETGIKTFPCDKITLEEHFNDGIQILSFLQKNSEKLIPTEGWELIGIEEPLRLEVRDDITYRGYLDIVLKEKSTGDIKIIDLKTSTKGWNQWAKKDEKKTNQLLIYKNYYSKLHNVPEEQIYIEFIILKRKLLEDCDFPQHRITSFEPSNGKPSMRKAMASFHGFLDECFNDDNSYNLNVQANPNKNTCRFCQFNKNRNLCQYSYYLNSNEM